MTKTFYPTLHQHLATDYRRNLAVTAGAGTGKTEVLTRRIVKILGREKHYLDRLLVLTFTDKAAVEMKERIYRAVDRELAASGDNHFQKLKDTFLHNYISTFHAFCATLLREYPIEAKIDPYFRVLDETEKVFFLRASINRTLRSMATDKNNQDIRVLSEEFSRAMIANFVFTVIQKREESGNWIGRMIDLEWPSYLERLKQYRACILREIVYKFHVGGSMREPLQVLEGLEADIPDTDYAVNRKRKAALALLKDLLTETARLAALETTDPYGEPRDESEMDVTRLIEIKEELFDKLKLSGSQPKAWPDEAYQQLKESFTAARYRLEVFPVEGFEISIEHEKMGFNILKALARVARHCLQTYHEEKNAENYLDFQDLQLRVERLLSEDKNRHILDELRDRFQYVMVDEFQDTNDLQWSIIRKIAADFTGQIVNPRVFVVGDEKQAIYSFRGGDVRLFSRVRRELREANRISGNHAHPFDLVLDEQKSYEDDYLRDMGDDNKARCGEIVFTDNFRSAQKPITFFNLYFQDLLSRVVYEEYDARPQLLRCAGNKTEGSVEMLLVENAERKYEDVMTLLPRDDDTAAMQAESPPQAPHQQQEAIPLKPHFKEALLIADKIKEVFLGDDEKYRRVRECALEGRPAVAILLSRRTMIKTYEEALRLSRINFSVIRGRGFFQRREIVDIGNLLTLLADRDDDAALAGFLRSPAGHLSDRGLLLLSRAGGGQTLWNKLHHCAEFLRSCDFTSGASGAGADSFYNDGTNTQDTSTNGLNTNGIGSGNARSGSFGTSEDNTGIFTTGEDTDDAVDTSHIKTENHFSLRDREAICDASANLKRWHSLSRRMPLVEFLRLIMKDGAYYAALGRGNRGEQAVSNLEKLLDSARELALMDEMDLTGFITWLNNRIDYIEEEGEADVDISVGGTVQIMTVHQSKGLEFPMVFVPDLSAGFNFGEREAICADPVPFSMTVNTGEISRRERTEIGVDAPDPDQDWEVEPILIRRVIRKIQRDKTLAEKRRLFYVACTRAMDHLVLVGNAYFQSDRLIQRVFFSPLDAQNNWLDWLNSILGISYQLKLSTGGTLKYTNSAGKEMDLPYRIFTGEGAPGGKDESYRTSFPLD